MAPGRKTLIYAVTTFLGLVVVLLIVRVFIGNSYRKQIPDLPDFQNVAAPIKEQIEFAGKKAHRRPNSVNLGMLGMAYHSAMYYDEARVCYELAIENDDDSWIWSYYLGYLNQEMGNPDAAIRNYSNVIKINPGTFLALYYKAGCYQKLGLTDSSELTLKRITAGMDKFAIIKTSDRYDYFPLVTYAMYDLSRLYVSSGDTDKAESTLREIIDYQRAFGPAYRLLGNIYSIRGDEITSKKFLVRANDLTISPSPVDTLIDKISLLSRSDLYLLKKIDEAEKSVYPEYALKLVNHSLSFFPDNKYLVAKAIRLFLIRDSVQQALPYLNKHIEYFKNDFNELKSVGDLLYNKGYYPQALNHYSYAVKLKPDDSQVQSCIVICLLKEGRKQEAWNKVNTNLENNKTNPAAVADGVTLLLSLGDKANAIIWLDWLKNLSPSFAKGLQLTGMLAEQDGNLNGAIANYTSAFNNDPSDMTTVRLLGNLLLKQKSWEKAVVFFKRALDFHPNEPFLLERLGSLLVTCPDLKLRDLGEGRDLCERAFIHTASHSMTLISAGRSLAIAYAGLGDIKNASNVIKMTINIALKENIPQAAVDDLRNLLREFSTTN
jgi:tetratricopeptide (TPR) repeat protein